VRVGLAAAAWVGVAVSAGCAVVEVADTAGVTPAVDAMAEVGVMVNVAVIAAAG
jgi:hypothetical protein